MPNVAFEIPKTTEQKQAKEKLKRSSYLLKMFEVNWQSQAVRVCKERLAHYEATGNERKADIYRRKLAAKPDMIEKIKSVAATLNEITGKISGLKKSI